MGKDGVFWYRMSAGVVVVITLVFAARLVDLQGFQHDRYMREAEHQYVATAPTAYERGNIYFQTKDNELVAAATLAGGYTIAIDPRKILDPQGTYNRLAQVIPLDATEFFAKAHKDDPYEEIAKRVSDASTTALKALDIPGLAAYRETWRTYPAKTLASQTIGFVGYDGDSLVGRYGLERQFNDVLSRRSENSSVNFFAELFAGIGRIVFDRGMEEEGDVVLTIEPSVQAELEKELAGVQEKYHPQRVGGIIMDPKTGAIIAMASLPTFDPNEYGKVSDPRRFMNPLVEDVMEMGSIMKAITMASGLDAKVVNANTEYNDVGYIMLNSRKISNYDGKGRGPHTTMQMVLNNSLNTGVSFVTHQLGNKRFADYFMNRFRLGEETGIDLPGEVQGLMGNLSSPRDVDYATASFGQGIAVTPVNMIAALSALGNGGTIPDPHVVDQIRYTSGRVKSFEQNPPHQAIAPTTSEEVTRMLTVVVDKALLGGSMKHPGYSIAAKTGTAQMAIPGAGYYTDRYTHTFFGYFPASDPKFIILLYAVDPHGEQYASHTLTAYFFHLTDFLLHYYQVPPDRGDASLTATTTPL